MTKWHRVKVKEIGATKIKEYEVDIEGDLNFHTKSKKVKIRWWCVIFKLLPLALIVALGLYTKSIFETKISTENTVVYIETDNSQIEGTPVSCKCYSRCCNSCCMHYGETVNSDINRKFNLYPILVALYFIILAVTVIVLIVIFSKDDSCLKFAKLDELNDVKQKLLEKNANLGEKIEERLNLYEHNGSWEKKNNSIITKSSEFVDLLKRYMTCVTEI